MPSGGVYPRLSGIYHSANNLPQDQVLLLIWHDGLCKFGTKSDGHRLATLGAYLLHEREAPKVEMAVMSSLISQIMTDITPTREKNSIDPRLVRHALAFQSTIHPTSLGRRAFGYPQSRASRRVLLIAIRWCCVLTAAERKCLSPSRSIIIAGQRRRSVSAARPARFHEAQTRETLVTHSAVSSALSRFSRS